MLQVLVLQVSIDSFYTEAEMIPFHNAAPKTKLYKYLLKCLHKDEQTIF